MTNIEGQRKESTLKLVREKLPLAEPTPSMRQNTEFLGEMVMHHWLPFSDKIKTSISWHETSGSSEEKEAERITHINRLTAGLKPNDLIYFVSSKSNGNLTGWEICHSIFIATKQALTAPGNLKSLRIYEDVHLGQGDKGVVSLLSWKEQYNSVHKISLIHDSFVAIRSGFQRENQKSPSEMGWGMLIYNHWLDFVERTYKPRDIIKIIAGSSKVESALCARFEGAKAIYRDYYKGGHAAGREQRMYCFTRDNPPKVIWKIIEEAQQVLQPKG